jgi:hypothetical protein
MSANNYIFIEKSIIVNTSSAKTKWVITHRDAEEGRLLSKIGKADTLEEAVYMANEWQTDNGYAEYGLHIYMPKKHANKSK